jgi:uncharacterized protein (TIGR00255 family)
MTGFARVAGDDAGEGFVWELKSVNARAFDARFRLPTGLDALEAPARTEIARRVKRGNVSAQLTLARAGVAPGLAVNEAFLDQLIALHGRYKGRVSLEPPRLDTLLTVRGVVEPLDGSVETPEAIERRHVAYLAGLANAVARLVEVRQEEGARLSSVMSGLLSEIEALHASAQASAGAQPAALLERLKAQLAPLLEAAPSISEERFAQEAAVLASKADIREELDRLKAHLAAARMLLAKGGAIGRELDFLCQEFNREANTLCSKAGEMALTEIGLKLKAAIERLREQVQNIE